MYCVTFETHSFDGLVSKRKSKKTKYFKVLDNAKEAMDNFASECKKNEIDFSCNITKKEDKVTIIDNRSNIDLI